MDPFEDSAGVKTAVITGAHPFDVPAFHAMFRSLAGVDCYPQDLADFVADAGRVRDRYDVLLFYNFHQQTPGEAGDPLDVRTCESLERLGQTAQGIFVLHHAILAYPNWPFWADLVGIPDRRFTYDDGQDLHIEIAPQEHVITRGLSAWTMTDEVYSMNNPGAGSETLLTTNHEKSMTSVAWARQFRQARVFCLQSGHDGEAFGNPNFRTVMERGIQWLAGVV